MKLIRRTTKLGTLKEYTLIALNKFNEAIEAYDKAIEIDPKNLEAWNNKGIALNELNKYDEAHKSIG